jgi:L-lactate dehydrogenase complex protein LldG
VPLALTLGHAAYAETGSVLLAEPDLADRGVGMLSGTLVVGLPVDHLLGGLDAAVADLRSIASRPAGGYAISASGPSRTADIERVLTVGVQGPGRVVVFVDELT